MILNSLQLRGVGGVFKGEIFYFKYKDAAFIKKYLKEHYE